MNDRNSMCEAKKIRFVHLFGDLKFIPNARRVYEAAMPGVHLFIYLKKDDEPVECDIEGVVLVSLKEQRSLGKSELLQGADFLCLHWVTIDKIRIARDFGDYTRVIPFIWGADLYPIFSKIRRNLYLPETSILSAECNRRAALSYICQPILLAKYMYRKLRFVAEWRYRAFYRRVRFCVPVIPQDGVLLKAITSSDVNILRHHYGSPELTLGDFYSSFNVSGEDVLLGNSAARTNNHLDILKVLADAELRDSKIYAPLSYADMPPYADLVEARGIDLLGDRFVSMRGFMSRGEYYSFLSRCRYVILPLYRQQAGGVIKMMVYAGATVFLFKENPFWEYYTQLGVKLVSLDDFISNPDLEAHKISASDAQNNRRIVDDHFSTEKVVARNREMFSTIIKSQ